MIDLGKLLLVVEGILVLAGIVMRASAMEITVIYCLIGEVLLFTLVAECRQSN
jgi:hypothetical protein